MNPRDELWMQRLDGDRSIALDREGEAEVAAYERFRDELRAGLRGGIDVEDVMLAVELNDAVAGGIDVDAVMASVELNDAVAGGIDVDAVMASVELNAAVAGGIDVDAVMASVELNAALAGGIDVDAVMASVALNDALAGGIDIDAVMERVDTRSVVEDEEPENVFPLPAPSSMPRWISLGAAPFGLLAAAAAVLFAVWPMAAVSTPSHKIVAEVVDPSFQLSAMNQAEVEDVSVDDDASVQILQGEDGGPTVILIDDPRGH